MPATTETPQELGKGHPEVGRKPAFNAREMRKDGR